jgi:hypothetical protein
MIESYFKEGNPMERKDLIKNDYYALFKTFDNVYQQFKEKVHVPYDGKDRDRRILRDIGGIDVNSYFC